MSINVLDQNTINKIAAGEVVERPASVVKELMENAIDAGSTAITIEIKDGGISFIRITDNGCGIPKNDVELAFLRHSTSKIKDAADLMNISSLGFRGEALSSISAVAQVELITKIRSELTGTRFQIDGGVKKRIEDVGAPDGTTFLVRNLFYNTPARRKFLKTAATEGGYISSMTEHLCLSHPEISFRFINNNQPKIQTVGNGNLKDVIYTIYGKDVTRNLIEINEENDIFSIKGYIGKPLLSRGNRNYENYYINGRYIKSSIVSKAIEDAYAPFVMQHKYPFTAFHLNISPEYLDVNVHPSKMELRFSNAVNIYETVKKVITEALTHKELIPDISLNTKNDKSDSAKKPYQAPPVSPMHPVDVAKTHKSDSNAPRRLPISGHRNMSEHEAMYNALKDKNEAAPELLQSPHNTEKKETSQVVFEKAESQAPSNSQEPKPQANPSPEKGKMPEPFEANRNRLYNETTKPVSYDQLELFPKNELLREDNKKDIKIIGQVFKTYWIVQYENNMYIIDQHAAHEKVLYEQFMKSYKEGKTSVQLLSPPVIFSLTMQESEVLKQNLQTFADLGFEIEEFGGEEYALRGIPSAFTYAKKDDLLLEILDDLVNESGRMTPESIKDKIATMACKAAVKGNNGISQTEAQALINELMELANPYNCPHGRPTMITLSKYELEKKFNRIV